MGQLDGKIAWVTGAGSGIGEAGAKALAESGATVVLSGRRSEELERVAGDIRSAGGKAEIEALDVANLDAVAKTAEAIATRFGRVDIMVASAGINVPNRAMGKLDMESWTRVVDINLDGLMACVMGVLPSMRAQGDGLLILISSWAGRHASMLTGAAYNATKHAVVALNHSINMEEGLNGIRSCVIMPGEVATPIMLKRPVPPSKEDMARMLQADDLGRTIRFVAEMPAHACVNEILIGPTFNRLFAATAKSVKKG